jgi:hypothetical protein
MNANALSKNYDCQTGEERFPLILVASGRGDEVERDRLSNAARRVTLSTSDHAPFAHAFDELLLLTFIELVEDATRFFHALERANDDLDLFGGHDNAEEDVDDPAEGEESEETDEGKETKADAEPAKDGTSERSIWQRSLELAYAAGYVLRTKAEGWKLFCERLKVPPFLLVAEMPGFHRLQCALALTDKTAFKTEGMVRWLNSIRPAEDPELTAIGLTVEEVADANAKMFRDRVTWWGG